MAYERVNWENLPSTKTPVNADNLNKLNDVSVYLLDTYKASGIELYEGSNAVVHNNLVILKMNFGGTFAANTNVTIATLPEKLRPNSVAAGSCTFHKNRKDMEAGVVVIFTDGHIEVSSPTTQTKCILTLTYSLN